MPKRIFNIDPRRVDELMSYRTNTIIIRPAKSGGIDEYVAESEREEDRPFLNKIAAEFDVD